MGKLNTLVEIDAECKLNKKLNTSGKFYFGAEIIWTQLAGLSAFGRQSAGEIGKCAQQKRV